MAEAGFPGQHTTTTTVTSSTTVQTNVRFDAGYLRTLPGVLKVVQVLCSLLGFICVQCSAWSSYTAGAFYSWISMLAFWLSGILLGLYLFHLVEKFYKIPWLTMEMGFCALFTFFFLLVSSIAATMPGDAYAAASFFGFMATLAYLSDAVLKYRARAAGGLAQGVRVVSTQTTSAAPVREAY